MEIYFSLGLSHRGIGQLPGSGHFSGQIHAVEEGIQQETLKSTNKMGKMLDIQLIRSDQLQIDHEYCNGVHLKILIK